MDRYYTYVHTVNDIPIYVGKGCDNRFKNKYLTNRSKEWHSVVKDNFSSSIIANGSEEEMLELEEKVIHRLATLGFPLVNKNHNPNWIYPQEVKDKMASKIKGKKHTDETKAKMSASQLGKVQDEAHVLNNLLAKLIDNKTKGYSSRKNRYKSEITIEGKTKYLGSYDTPEEAHHVYLNAKAERIAELEARLQELQERKVA